MTRTINAAAPRGLSRADLSATLGLVAALAEIRPLAALRREVIEALVRVVPSQLISWNELDLMPEGADFEIALYPDIAASVDPQRMAVLNAAFGAHIGEHPVISYFQDTGDGQPRTISDFLTPEEFHATELYRSFYGQPELTAEDQLSLTLPEPDLVIGIALNRPQADFTDRDRTILNLVRPPVSQAYRNAAALDRTERILSALEQSVETDGEGLVLLGRGLLVEHCTPRAAGLLERYGLRPERQRLPAGLSDWLDRPQLDPQPEWPLVVDRHGHRLLVRHVSGPFGEALLLSEQRGDPAPATLTRLGLTARQAEVMALIAAGVPSKQVASRLGISPRTVDKHVEHALRTLGAESRLSAANLIRQADWRAAPGGCDF